MVEAAGTAKAAGLRYVTDEAPGITRTRRGKAFHYRFADGRPVRNRGTLARIQKLVIPPAWTEVWICAEENGHLQATGRDARGRKQHRYHADWRAVRDESKYERTIAFGRALPRIRRAVERDLRRRGLGRTKVLAAVTRLLEATLIRVGNEEYARQNGSFGLSTLRDRHVAIKGGAMRFEFRGKSGKRHTVDLHDPRLAKIVRGAQELPGQTLFQYSDENGEPQKISSEDVNAYLREIAGEEFSAKDFRTWAGTVLAAEALQQFERFDSETQAKKNVLRAIEAVAEKLGNTPAICRKSYIHPVVLNGYLDGLAIRVLETRAERTLRSGLGKLTPTEAAVLAFLQQQLRGARRRGGGATRSKKARGRRRTGKRGAVGGRLFSLNHNSEKRRSAA